MLFEIKGVSKRPSSVHPILNLGFRVFFVGASLFAVAIMLLWTLVLQGIAPFKHTISPFVWHGHEMIFGYALAVVAGFLLTAVKMWTGQLMPYGCKLLGIFVLWLLARLLWLALHAVSSDILMILAFASDMLFWFLTSFAVSLAVYRARQKRQIGIIAKLLLLFCSHVVFYVAIWANNADLQTLALYFALYLVIGVVLTIARRVLPFFISKGVGVDNQGKPNGITIEQKNSDVLDKISLLSFVGFVVCDLFLPYEKIASLFAVICFVANIWRLKNWYHQGIWQKPLLWSLVIAFFGMISGLLLIAIYPFVASSLNLHSLGIHGLALFGIGLMTLAMMARVSLGHTGRNIHMPPKTIGLIFVLMIISGLCRVLMPLLFDEYMVWLLISQITWIMAFVLFGISYIAILSKPRTDGLFG